MFPAHISFRQAAAVARQAAAVARQARGEKDGGIRQMDFARYEQYRETGVHEVPGFAYNTYLCTIPQDFARVRPHWHDQMEIVYVKRGSGTVSTNFVRQIGRAHV